MADEFAFAYTTSGKMILETNCFGRATLGDIIPSFLSLARSEIDLAFSLIHPRSVNFFHWVSEQLSRLEAVEVFRSATGLNPRVIVSRNITELQRESLRFFGVHDADIVFFDGRPIAVKTFVLPSVRRSSESPGAPFDCMSRNACRWLRTVALKAGKNGGAAPVRPRRVFVSRANAQGRNLVNEADVVHLLERFGFECCVPDQLSFSEQVSLFSNVDFLIGPHGAGLTNLLWCRSNSTVVEFMPIERIRPDFFQLAGALGFRHALQYCKSVNNQHDMQVDTAVLERMLHQLA